MANIKREIIYSIYSALGFSTADANKAVTKWHSLWLKRLDQIKDTSTNRSENYYQSELELLYTAIRRAAIIELLAKQPNPENAITDKRQQVFEHANETIDSYPEDGGAITSNQLHALAIENRTLLDVDNYFVTAYIKRPHLGMQIYEIINKVFPDIQAPAPTPEQPSIPVSTPPQIDTTDDEDWPDRYEDFSTPRERPDLEQKYENGSPNSTGANMRSYEQIHIDLFEVQAQLSTLNHKITTLIEQRQNLGILDNEIQNLQTNKVNAAMTPDEQKSLSEEQVESITVLQNENEQLYSHIGERIAQNFGKENDPDPNDEDLEDVDNNSDPEISQSTNSDRDDDSDNDPEISQSSNSDRDDESDNNDSDDEDIESELDDDESPALLISSQPNSGFVPTAESKAALEKLADTLNEARSSLGDQDYPKATKKYAEYIKLQAQAARKDFFAGHTKDEKQELQNLRIIAFDMLKVLSIQEKIIINTKNTEDQIVTINEVHNSLTNNIQTDPIESKYLAHMEVLANSIDEALSDLSEARKNLSNKTLAAESYKDVADNIDNNILGNFDIRLSHQNDTLLIGYKTLAKAMELALLIDPITNQNFDLIEDVKIQLNQARDAFKVVDSFFPNRRMKAEMEYVNNLEQQFYLKSSITEKTEKLDAILELANERLEFTDPSTGIIEHDIEAAANFYQKYLACINSTTADELKLLSANEQQELADRRNAVFLLTQLIEANKHIVTNPAAAEKAIESLNEAIKSSTAIDQLFPAGGSVRKFLIASSIATTDIRGLYESLNNARNAVQNNDNPKAEAEYGAVSSYADSILKSTFIATSKTERHMLEGYKAIASGMEQAVKIDPKNPNKSVLQSAITKTDELHREARDHFKKYNRLTPEARIKPEADFINKLQAYIDKQLKDVIAQAKNFSKSAKLGNLSHLNEHLQKFKLPQAIHGMNDHRLRKQLHEEWDTKFQLLLKQVTDTYNHTAQARADLERYKNILENAIQNLDPTNKYQKAQIKDYEKKYREALEHSKSLMDVSTLKDLLEKLDTRINSTRLTATQEKELQAKIDAANASGDVALVGTLDAEMLSRREWQSNNTLVEVNAIEFQKIDRGSKSADDFAAEIANAVTALTGKPPVPTASAALSLSTRDPMDGNAHRIDFAKSAAVMSIGEPGCDKMEKTVFTMQQGVDDSDFVLTVHQTGTKPDNSSLEPHDMLHRVALLVEKFIDNADPAEKIVVSGKDPVMKALTKAYLDAMKEFVKDPIERKRYEWTDPSGKPEPAPKADKKAAMEYIEKNMGSKNMRDSVNRKNVYMQESSKLPFTKKMETRLGGEADTIKSVTDEMEQASKRRGP